MLSVNLRAAMVCCRAVLPTMLRQGEGTIVNVASIAAKRALPGSADYTATKAGLPRFTPVLAQGLRKTGVRVGGLMPRAVGTPLSGTGGRGPPRATKLAPPVRRAGAPPI